MRRTQRHTWFALKRVQSTGMIRHKQFTTGTGRSGAAKYFTEHLSVSAYYANGVGLQSCEY